MHSDIYKNIKIDVRYLRFWKKSLKFMNKKMEHRYSHDNVHVLHKVKKKNIIIKIIKRIYMDGNWIVV